MSISDPELLPATKVSDFGLVPDGSPAHLFTVTRGAVTAKFTDFGARIVSIEIPDRNGISANVVLGFSSAEGYADPGNYDGAIVGRFANRLAEGRFSIDGETYQVPQNNGPNALHGGPDGFSTKLWQGRAIEDGVEFTLISPDLEMGFPGTLTSVVRYTLAVTEAGTTLEIDINATTDKTTVVNLTNHAFYNLTGVQPHGKTGTILAHELIVAAEHFTPTNSVLIPTGELAPVQGTPFDFRQPTAIGARIEAHDEQLTIAGGYDHNFVLGAPGTMKLAARLSDPRSGRVLTVETTEPGIQFYSGNFLPKSDAPFLYRTGLCLETQHFPDAPNQPGFPSTDLKPGDTLKSKTLFTFSVRP